jgi:predicted amidohydrolase
MSTNRILQVSCVRLHWGKSLARNLESTLNYIRLAADEGSRMVLFPEANLTGYFFPDGIELAPEAVERALERTCRAAAGAMIKEVNARADTKPE